MDQNEEINFVARHYRQGRFNAARAWKRVNPAPRVGWWRRYGVAAAVAAIILLSASAALIYNLSAPINEPATQGEMAAPEPSPMEVVKVIDFEDTPLTTVVQRIEEVYGVAVTNLPDNADELRLSLHYEGDAADLIATINDILNTQLTAAER